VTKTDEDWADDPGPSNWRVAVFEAPGTMLLAGAAFLGSGLVLAVVGVLGPPIAILFGLVFGAIGLALLRDALPAIAATWAIRGHGRRVTGVVVGHRIRHHGEIRRQTYTVVYRYVVAGQEYSGHRAFLDQADAERLRTGDPVTLLVDPRDPARSIVA
jgi:hypothetical protein